MLSGVDGWVRGYPLDCYDYQSTCGANDNDDDDDIEDNDDNDDNEDTDGNDDVGKDGV